MVTSTKAPVRRPRGLFDACLTVVLLYAVYATTPVGAVAETAVNIARGQKQHPSWLATFRGRETHVSGPTQAPLSTAAASSDVPAAVAAAAQKHGADVDALAALMAVQGICDAKQCDAETPPRLATVLPGAGAAARTPVDELARALAAGTTQLEGQASLAVEALYVGLIPVHLAVEQARRSNAAVPTDVEDHAGFFTPSARRGPLQAALAVLAVHRLRSLSWPADPSFRVTSPFGGRVHPVTGKVSFHNGTDIGTPTGTPLRAAAGATVKRQSQDSISGNYVVLDLGLGLETVYCHLSEPRVKEGARLQRQGEVGLSGATGRVTGPHLHYILRVRDTPVDAQLYGEGTRAGRDAAAP